MSKQYNIRWGRSDYSKLSHVIRKVNQKVFSIEVQRPDIAGAQPAMLDYQEVKAKIKTRQDFKNFVNMYERYLREGVEETVKSGRGANETKWAIRELKIMERADNTRKRHEHAKLQKEKVTIAGKEQDVTRAEMKSVRENSFKPSNRTYGNMSKDEFKHAFQLLEQKMYSNYREEKAQIYLRQYIKGLIAEGYPEELLDIMSKIDPKVFYKHYFKDEVATIDFIYDPAFLKDKSDLLTEFWSQFADEDINNGVDFDVIRKEVQTEYENGERIKGTGRVRKPQRKRRK